MLEFKAALLIGVAAQIEEMAHRWTQMENSFRDSMDVLALELDRLKRDGEDIKISKLIRMERYQRLRRLRTGSPIVLAALRGIRGEV